MKRYGVKIFALLGAIVLWYLMAIVGPYFKLINPIMLPTPWKVATTMVELSGSGELWRHTGSSVARFLLGFLVAAVIGIPMGVGMGRSRLMGDLLGTVTELLRPIAPTAWIPLSILWLGLGIKQQVFIVFIGAFFPILLNTIAGVRSVEAIYIRAALTLGAKERDTIRRIILPSAVPNIVTGLKIGLGVGWMCIVTAELVAADSGLGYMIQDARMLLNTHIVLAGMITIGIIGLILTQVLTQIERRVCRWQATQHTREEEDSKIWSG